MLKNLLRAMFSSLVQTSWEQQKTKGNSISIRADLSQASDNDVYVEQTSPCEGYVIFAAWNVANVSLMSMATQDLRVGNIWAQNNNGDFRVLLPCKKGEVFQGKVCLAAGGASSTRDGYFYFFPKVGSN